MIPVSLNIRIEDGHDGQSMGRKTNMTIEGGPRNFTDDFFDALGAWQRGWKADEDLKKPVTENLTREAAVLPAEFRAVPDFCYRKRFLFKKDMESLIMFCGLDDGVARAPTRRSLWPSKV
jgi:hypothetical protein